MNILLLIFALLAYALAGLANGVMDTLAFHYETSKASNWNYFFWNPKYSWKNKYKNFDETQGPRFPGSTTWLVWTTDGWHLSKTIYLAMQRAALVLAVAAFTSWSWWVYPMIWVWLIFVHAGGFHLSYSIVLKDRES